MVFHKLDSNLSVRNYVVINLWKRCALDTFWKILGTWNSSHMSQGLAVAISGDGIAADSHCNQPVTFHGWRLPRTCL